MQDEQTLVRRAQEHEQDAFAELYERYFDKIYRYCVMKTGNRAEAEDMTQQVFIKAAKSISSFKWRNVPFSAWLYRIAHNQLVDYLRKKSRQHSLPLDEAVAVSDSNPQKTTELKMDIKEMIEATKGLTAAQREVISLRFASELPIARVAEIMGKSQGAVKALQHSAIVALRKKMVGVVDNG